MLQCMIKLEPSTPDTNPLQGEARVSTYFYVREFEITAVDARNVLTSMLHDGYDMNPNIFYWMERLNGMHDSAIITLRYCGQTKNRPWDRHVDDVYSKSLKTFLGRFHKTVGMICPRVLAAARVFTVVDATALQGLAQKYKDTTEQILIALFGDSVLNTEQGGKDFIILTSDDEKVFTTLQTRTVSQLAKLVPCTQLSMVRLREYAASVADHVSQNPTTRQGNKTVHKFSKATQDMLVEQGTFKALSDGSAIMVCLGSDLGDDHEEDEKPFFEAGGRSADTMTTLFNYFGHWEKGINSSFDEGFTKKLAADHQLPFVDYFAWYVKHKDDYEAASRLTARFMSLAKPYIVLAYGGLVCYTILSLLLRPVC
jgi:hypothetical protein